jgi:uncharacterized protein
VFVKNIFFAFFAYSAVKMLCPSWQIQQILNQEDSKMIELSKQDLHDILYGCTILGTGGGGSLEKGLALVDDALAKGKTFRLVDFSEVPDEAWIAVPFNCGSISPTTPELEALYAGLPQIDEPLPYLAYKALEKYIGTEFYGVMSTELGGGNTAEALYVGAWLGKYIIDADPAGRSVPELQHSTFFINDIPCYPFACANEFGDVAILPYVVNDLRAEALVRAMAVASKNRIGVADHPSQAKTLRNKVINGAISYAWKIGKAFRQAREAHQQAAPVIAKIGGGTMLFEGTVNSSFYETENGFTVGDVFISGDGDYDGSEYHIWFKNEHMISWRDEKVDVTVPDLIIVFNEENGEPNINPFFKDGMRVSVIGLPSAPQWRTARGLHEFGPRHFGYDFDFVALEERHKQ